MSIYEIFVAANVIGFPVSLAIGMGGKRGAILGFIAAVGFGFFYGTMFAKCVVM